MFLWTGLGQGCLRDHFRRAGNLKNEGKWVVLRIYGFKGACGAEGEGFARIRKSSYKYSSELLDWTTRLQCWYKFC